MRPGNVYSRNRCLLRNHVIDRLLHRVIVTKDNTLQITHIWEGNKGQQLNEELSTEHAFLLRNLAASLKIERVRNFFGCIHIRTPDEEFSYLDAKNTILS